MDIKVLLDMHMIGKNPTGVARYCENLAKFLKKESGVKICQYLGPKNAYYRVFFGLNREIKRCNPNIVHVDNFVPIKTTLPVVVTIHDLIFKEYKEFFPWKRLLGFKLFFEYSLTRANAVICDSFSTKNSLLKIYNKIDTGKVFVIYLGADRVFSYIKNKRDVKEGIRKKFNIKTNYFLVVGNIEKRKNILPIIRAFLELVNSGKKDVELVFVGENKMINSTDLIDEACKTGDKVKFLGFTKDQDLNLLYNGARALVFNSTTEGFGLPLVEAMQCRVPIICSNIPIFKEIANNAPIFTDSENDIYNGMVKLLRDYTLYKKLSNFSNIRGKIFSFDKTARETLEVYKWVLKIK